MIDKKIEQKKKLREEAKKEAVHIERVIRIRLKREIMARVADIKHKKAKEEAKAISADIETEIQVQLRAKIDAKISEIKLRKAKKAADSVEKAIRRNLKKVSLLVCISGLIGLISTSLQ